ncbi:MAG: hypothetical protein KKB50_21555 [Planctomycetes bacterium]|nr:hypothetical protein [Planctomycetota bacterium]
MSGVIQCNGDLAQFRANGDLSGLVTVSGDLPWFLVMGDIPTGGHLEVGGSVGDSHVEGSVSGTIEIGHALYGQLFVNGMLNNGALEIGDITGTGWLLLMAGSSANGTHINIARDLDGYLESRTDLACDVTIGGDMNGMIEVGEYSADLLGCLDILGDLTGTLDINGDVTGDIHVGGNMAGSIDIAAYLNGEIQIDGSLLVNQAVDFEIQTSLLLPSTAAITVDYDGWNESDVWQPGAKVRTSYKIFEGNSPNEAENIWEITRCKGDMNNDEVVNGFDIDPFVTALGDAGQ